MTRIDELDHIGKRMPYTMPPECYNEMEAKVFAALQSDARNNRKRKVIRVTMLASVAAAAVVALLLVIAPAMKVQHDSLNQIDVAYAQLSDADKNYLMEVYQEDIFLNQEQE